MIATHRVKNSNNETVGFIVDKEFYNDSIIKNNIGSVDNLRLLKNGTVRAKKTLPELQYKEAVTRRNYEKMQALNPFKRDIEEKLREWKKTGYRSILQIEGARQIGKTTEILKFAYSNYENVIYINLVSDQHNFKYCLRANPLYFEMVNYCQRANLSKFDNSRNTIIIIDEIQEDVTVFNSLRTLRSELNCDIIITGSYLGTMVTNFTQEADSRVFFSVGTVSPVTMFSMSFREFCRAFDNETNLMQIDIHGQSDKNDYMKLQKLYNLYCTIGGYPSVVAKYKETRDIKECHSILGGLLAMFKQESSRYFRDPKQITVFDFVYEQAITEMLTEKRGNGKKIVGDIVDFIKNNSNTVVSRDEVSNAIHWLTACKIIGTCDLVNGNDFLKKQPNRRLYFMDCGLATYIASNLAISNSSKDGLITETFAFCELKKLYFEGFSTSRVKGSLCFSVYNQYELDFMLVGKGGSVENTIFGIEVKTTKGDPKSLKVYIDKSILAEHTQGGNGGKFDTIPIYTVGARFPYK